VRNENTRHATSTRDATYTFVLEIDVLARFKVEECACACNSDALVQPVALLETLRDLPLHSLAHAFVAELLHAGQTNNYNDNPPQLTTSTSVTLLLLFRPSAMKRPPTSVKPLSLCITRRHTSRQPPASSRIHILTSSMHAPYHALPPSHTPAYQDDGPQALESAEACEQRPNVAILQLVQHVA
jgi:hypothetical protein